MTAMIKLHDDLFLTASGKARLELYQTIRAMYAAQASVSERIDAARFGRSLVKEVNLKTVAAGSTRNYGSIYHLYNELLRELATLVDDRQADLAAMFALPEATVRYHMIQSTVAWRFLTATLSEECTELATFVASQHLSKGTVLRHLQALKALATTFGVPLHMENMQFGGCERRIRLFLLTVFWQATDGVAWPFDFISEATAGRLIDNMYQSLDTQPTNPVARAMAMYYLAITYGRIKTGHVLVYDRQQIVLDYPLPHIDLPQWLRRFPDIQLPAMTRSQLMGEANFAFFLMHFEPVYLVADDPQVPLMIERFRQYAPGIYKLVAGFVASFPEWSGERSVTDSKLLMANLLAVASSVVALGTDYNQLVAYTFNTELTQRLADSRYRRAVHQTLAQVMLSAHLEHFMPQLPVLADNFYRNLIQLRTVLWPQMPLKVALVLEQTTIAYVDLLAMLDQQNFVTLLPNGVDLREADLVIECSALPLNLPKRIARFTWDPGSGVEAFGDLFATMLTLWRQKAIDRQFRLRRA